MRIGILRAGNRGRREQGFTYIVLLVALVVMGILAEVATIASAKHKQRELEQDLLYRGQAYQDAIQSYYQSTMTRQYPEQIDDLLYDNRFSFKRHLRKAYPDPISGGEWKLLYNSAGGIVGVASKGTDRPLKRDGFYPPYEHFANAEHYYQWIFIYQPATSDTTLNVLNENRTLKFGGS